MQNEDVASNELSFFNSSLINFNESYKNESYQVLTTDNQSADFNGLPSFGLRSFVIVLVYGAFFIVSAIGNLTVFMSLIISPRRKTRFNLMILNLTLADMIVTFVMLPLEIIWRITVQWFAGNVACKILLFIRAFGLYLSSNILVCISLDRYFAVLHPLKVTNATRRGKMMILAAWIVSIFYALPQSIVFHVEIHPQFPNFTQCVTMGFFSNAMQESLYTLFCIFVMYFVPLLVIVFTYPAIICEIYKKSQEYQECKAGNTILRRSDVRVIERAKVKTLRMALTIVIVFMVCWTPYVVIVMWYVFDKSGALNVPFWIQEGLFAMAISNSCMNPLVYGSFVIEDFKAKCLHYFSCAWARKKGGNEGISPAEMVSLRYKSKKVIAYSSTPRSRTTVEARNIF